MPRRSALLAPLALLPKSRTAAGTPAREQRIVAPEGAVHLFQPRRYDATTAGIAIYVHGLYTTVNEAWREHHLPEQFAQSGRNALFIAPAARTTGPDVPPWGDLPALLEVVARAVPLPKGPLVVAGHSGAYKEILLWLAHPRLHTVLFLDALYGGEPELRAWLDAAPENRMALINHDTIPAARAFVGGVPYAVHRKRSPHRYGGLGRAERAAKLLSMDTRTDHFAIVTGGEMLPMLLRWSGLPAR
jgi:hypothetical protein